MQPSSIRSGEVTKKLIFVGKKQTTGDLHRNKENLNAMYFSWIFLEHFHWMQLLDMQKWLNLPTKKWER